ncbi:hypothetical protein BH10PLA2_BH10PLA2_10900 [soil metagenome]
MDVLSILIPDSLKQFIEDQVDSGLYKSTSEYLEHLIRKDHDRIEHEKTEARILEAVNRSEFSPMNADDWNQLENEIRSQASRRAQK